jgi:YegS/Rv2252/BmrU family lipid kinase
MAVSLEHIWLIIANPYSSGGKTKKKWPLIEKYLQSEEIEYQIQWTKEKNHATRLSKEAIQNGFKTIISLGGDGTHNEVVNGIMEQSTFPSTDISFGVIPGGTGNDWIKSHGIPRNYKKCISLIQKGKTKLQDVGIVEYGNQLNQKRFFINAAGFAYDAYLIKEMEQNVTFISSSLIYMFNILKYLLKYRAEEMVLKFNNKTIKEYFYTVNACLGKYAGGGLMIAPHAKPDDGNFALTMAFKLSKIQILLNLYRFYNGTIGKHSKIDTLHSKSIFITNKDKKVNVEVDGEYLGASEVKLSLISSSLKLFC